MGEVPGPSACDDQVRGQDHECLRPARSVAAVTSAVSPPSTPAESTPAQRWLARLSFLLVGVAIVILGLFAGLRSLAMLAVGGAAAVVSLVSAYFFLSRRGIRRWLSLAVFVLAPIAVIVVYAFRDLLWVAVASAAAWLLATVTARWALAGNPADWRMPEHPAQPPARHPQQVPEGVNDDHGNRRKDEDRERQPAPDAPPGKEQERGGQAHRRGGQAHGKHRHALQPGENHQDHDRRGREQETQTRQPMLRARALGARLRRHGSRWRSRRGDLTRCPHRTCPAEPCPSLCAGHFGAVFGSSG